MRVKKRLRPEWFLSENSSRAWVIRAGVGGLEEHLARWRHLAREDRVCCWCTKGVVEDEDHFLDECEAWREERGELWRSIGVMDAGVARYVAGWRRRDRVDWLLRGGNSKTRMVVLKGIVKWRFAREKRGRGKVGSEAWGERTKGEELDRRTLAERRRDKEKRKKQGHRQLKAAEDAGRAEAAHAAGRAAAAAALAAGDDGAEVAQGQGQGQEHGLTSGTRQGHRQLKAAAEEVGRAETAHAAGHEGSAEGLNTGLSHLGDICGTSRF